MAWSDEPTDAQLNAVFMAIRWVVPTMTAQRAVTWLKYHTTRRDVSDEMKRLKELKEKRELSVLNCFESEIWEGFLSE